MSITREAKQEVEKLLIAGKRIQAIKYLSDAFQVSLAEARILVEAVEREMSPSNISQTYSSPSLSVSDDVSDKLVLEVEQLLRENKKLEAVKHVRLKRNVGLKEALAFVEDVQRTVNPGFVPLRMAHGCAGTFKIVTIIFGGIGIIFLIVAGVIFLSQESVISNSEQMTGRVVELRTDDNQSYAPVIAYQWHGEELQYVDNIYSNPPAHEVGEELNIFVNRDDPYDIVIDSFADRWLFIVIFGGMGAFFTSLMILFVFVSRKF